MANDYFINPLLVNASCELNQAVRSGHQMAGNVLPPLVGGGGGVARIHFTKIRKAKQLFDLLYNAEKTTRRPSINIYLIRKISIK